MSTLRSESMLKGTLVVPSNIQMVHDLLDRIGRLGIVEFIDMFPDQLSHRPYNVYIQRIEEMERIIRYLYDEITKLESMAINADGTVMPLVIRAPHGEESFLQNGQGYVLERVEDALNRLYAQFVRFNENNKNLLMEKYAALEEKYVLLVAKQQLSQSQALNTIARGASGRDMGEESILEQEDHLLQGSPSSQEGQGSSLRRRNTQSKRTEGPKKMVDASGSVSSIAGVINCNDTRRFQGMLFRATRGNAYCFFQSIDGYALPELHESGKDRHGSVEKTVFVVFHQGTRSSQLHNVVKNIAQAFTPNIYDWPASEEECDNRLAVLDGTANDKARAVSAYERYFLGEISTLLECTRPNGSSLIEEWKMFCRKEKAIYATMNCFEGQDVTLRCMCWIPAAREAEVRDLVKQFEDESGEGEQGSAVLLMEKEASKGQSGHDQSSSPLICPPTYFKSTEFTEPSQMLVDTYGIPRYKEANPAVLTSVTFPFLYGVMYGDAGHGGIVLLLGLYLWAFNGYIQKQENGGFIKSLAPYRYMLTLMGFFAFFGGFMYNDVFALGVDIFGTRWTYDGAETLGNAIILKSKGGDPYPFGVDPAWKGATNELLMTNSIKMKVSVLIGFFHMFVGVLLSGMNNIHNRDMLEFGCEFVPKVIFMLSLVGYLDFLIVYKWCLPNDDPVYNKPNIIATLINMFMFGAVPDGDKLFSAQQMTERVLYVLLLLSVPVMLFVKPIVLISRQKKQHSEKEESKEFDIEHQGEVKKVEKNAEHEEQGASDIFIFQMIETIEFVLGTISNTASYLRLWALSLAHQQLSLVFYTQLVVRGLTMSDNFYVTIIALFIVFIPFAFITFAIILCMDLLEVALHALRLQWVEFQNKFFKGDGRRFQPLALKKVILEVAS